jgi:hypothetical protein
MTKAFFQAQSYAAEHAAAETDPEREKLVDAVEAATVAEVRGLVHLFYRLRKPELRFSPEQEQLGKATEAAVAAIEAYDDAHKTEAPKDGTPSAGSREQSGT